MFYYVEMQNELIVKNESETDGNEIIIYPIITGCDFTENEKKVKGKRVPIFL